MIAPSRAGIVVTILLGVYAVITLLVPLAVAAMWSFVDPANGWFAPALVPPSTSLTFWREVTSSPGVVGALVNSLIISVVVTTLTVILAIPTAWAPHSPSTSHCWPGAAASIVEACTIGSGSRSAFTRSPRGSA